MSGFDWNRHHADQERKERRKAAVFSTVTYVAILAACVFLVAFQEITPPPGEQFVAVGMADFGNVEEAGGDRETETPSEEVEGVIEQEVSESTVEEVAPVEAIETQEVSSRERAMLAPKTGRLRARGSCPDWPRESSPMVVR